MKGIFCACVLIHHLYQHSGVFREGYLALLGCGLQALGYVSTAMFFFLSGYGLTASYASGSRIQEFPKRTIKPFYIIMLVLTFLYCGFLLLIGKDIQVTDIIKSLLFGSTIIIHGWYLQAQLIYYLFFYLVFRYCKKDMRFVVMVCLHLLYIFACVLFGLSALYYERTFIFVFGMVWCNKRKEIDAWFDKGAHAFFIWVASSVIFAFFYICSLILHSKYLPTVARGISYFFFVIVVILTFRKTDVRNIATKFLGRISLELYVVQGAVLTFFHSNVVYLDNPVMYIIVSTTVSVMIAFFLHPVIRYIYKVCRPDSHPA